MRVWLKNMIWALITTIIILGISSGSPPLEIGLILLGLILFGVLWIVANQFEILEALKNERKAKKPKKV